MVVFLHVELRKNQIQLPSRGLPSLSMPMGEEYKFRVPIPIKLLQIGCNANRGAATRGNFFGKVMKQVTKYQHFLLPKWLW
jgi:hypothetical protein